MFARQVDPLADYSSTLSAAEQYRRTQHEAFDQEQEDGLHAYAPSDLTSQHSDSKSSSGTCHNPYKRKHPFQFDPEFFAALDSSLTEQQDAGSRSWSNRRSTSLQANSGSPWPMRPCKRPKKSILSRCLSSSPKPTSFPGSPRASSPVGASSSASHQPSTPVTSAPTSHNDTKREFQSPYSPSVCKKSTRMTAVFSTSNGPSIIDLSSGEELVALHLGENEHKRRRDSTSEPTFASPSTDSLREVIEFQDDGNLLPILDHCPARPTPVKKVRLSKALQRPHLRFLSDVESDTEGSKKDGVRTDRQYDHSRSNLHRLSHCNGWQETAYRKGATFVRDTKSIFVDRCWNDVSVTSGIVGVSSDMQREGDSPPDQSLEKGEHKFAYSVHHQACKKILRALVRYKGPKAFAFAEGIDVFSWDPWTADGLDCVVPEGGFHGQELVLYQGGQSRYTDEWLDQEKYRLVEPNEDSYSTSVLIEELVEDDEDDGNLADDEECEFSDEGPLLELEEKIMDMDLD
ncbi:hypothetical protein BGX28_005503 [Mortierella sp. GBA30]|nr:hypothetical protein BGX28_005503 [Mortierella sp. GBA30]